MSKVLTLVFLVLFSITFIGCGGNSLSIAPISNKTISGLAADGLISGANVGVDTNNNNSLDSSEILTKTNSLGFYTFDVSNDSTGNILVSSGVDTSINLAFNGVLAASLPQFSTIQNITPLTSLLANGKSIDSIRAMFGLTAGIDINSVNPVENTTVYKAGVKLHTAASLIASATSSNFVNIYEKLSTMPSFDSTGITYVLTSLNATYVTTIASAITNVINSIESKGSTNELTSLQKNILQLMSSEVQSLIATTDATAFKNFQASFIDGFDLWTTHEVFRNVPAQGTFNADNSISIQLFKSTLVLPINSSLIIDSPNRTFATSITETHDFNGILNYTDFSSIDKVLSFKIVRVNADGSVAVAGVGTINLN